MKPADKFSHPELYCLRAGAFAIIFLHHFAAPYVDRIAQIDSGGMFSVVITALVNSSSVGMDLFFCLSSFLITHLLFRELDARGSIDVPAFLARRSLRILPLYLVFMALTIFVFPRLIPGEHLSSGYTAAFLFFGANWLCAFSGYPGSVAAPLWSVSAEQQFYLLWPLLISWFSPRRVLHLAVYGLAISTGVRLVVLQLGVPHPAIWANTLAHLDPIAAGACCAVFIRHFHWRPTRVLRWGFLALGMALPPVLLLAFGAQAYHGPWSLIFYPTVGVACICLLGGVYREDKLNCPAWAVYLGNISYGLFIFHSLAIQIVRSFCAEYLPNPANLPIKIGLVFSMAVVAFGLTLGLASLSYRYLESPFLLLKSRFSRAKPDRKPARTVPAPMLEEAQRPMLSAGSPALW